MTEILQDLKEKNRQLMFENSEIKKQNTAITWKMAWDQKGNLLSRN
jgi:hypothetical protein